MVRRHDYVFQAFLGLAIVSIVFLIPSTGFATLTIPDDSQGNAAMYDAPHAAKRAFDDTGKAFVASLRVVELLIHRTERAMSIGGALRPTSKDLCTVQERAPPIA
jgi:hypothetical protein